MAVQYQLLITVNAEFKGTVVAVTHDRYFLDNVAGWILELDRGQGIPFEGNYSEWLKAKAKRLEVHHACCFSAAHLTVRTYTNAVLTDDEVLWVVRSWGARFWGLDVEGDGNGLMLITAM